MRVRTSELISIDFHPYKYFRKMRRTNSKKNHALANSSTSVYLHMNEGIDSRSQWKSRHDFKW